MTKKILCKKLNKELPALSIPPMPGPKGIEIMDSISEEAWEMWKSHQTTLINEKHLDTKLYLIRYRSTILRCVWACVFGTG